MQFFDCYCPISCRYKNVLDRKNGELPPECTPNIDRSETKHVHQPKEKGFIYIALLLTELTYCILISFGHAHNNIIFKLKET